MDNGEFYHAILENLYDGVYFVDRKRNITYWNGSAERITGYSRSDMLGRCGKDNLLMHVDESRLQLCSELCPLLATINDGSIREAHVFLHHKDGHRVPVLVRAAPIKDGDGQIIGAVETFSNSTNLIEARQRVAELGEALMRDTLTGVGNRAYLQMKTESALMERRQGRIPISLLFIDIDRFKSFNDTYGHDVGDKVLKMVADTLRHSVRATDSVGRWGGEEFAVLLERAGCDEMAAVAEKLRALVEKSLLPLGDRMVRVTISVGAVQIREDDTPDTLFHRADQAMYQSKTQGRNRVTIAD
ncbi:MAG: diguanylate cyclase [Chloroflexi bacterium]|nr:diguanylate cyclase [Chloroflexota bacterium]